MLVGGVAMLLFIHFKIGWVEGKGLIESIHEKQYKL